MNLTSEDWAIVADRCVLIVCAAAALLFACGAFA